MTAKNKQQRLEAAADKDTKKKEDIHVDLKTDTFSTNEQQEIVRMVKLDIMADIETSQAWIEDRRKDIEMYEGERPSIIENLEKDDWMSDRNLGLCAATSDAYQATLLATCWNIDTLHFKATEANDVDRKDQLVKFTKWGLGEKEANFHPEADDFIHNKITQGISYFYIYWDVWYEWVDTRTPVYDKDGELDHYDIKTEYKRFEKGVIENIADVSDLMFPRHGNTLQKKTHLIHRIKRTAKDIFDLSRQGIFTEVTEDYTKTLRKYCWDNRTKALSDEKAEQLGLVSEDKLTEPDLRLFPIDLYQWWGKYKKNGKEEEYRFIIEPETNKFLSGKPLRKITRSGKRPYIGRPFIRRPGFVRGGSLPRLISDPVNAFNNTYNQKSDFQYVENCPSGWYNPDEVHKKQELKITPGRLNPTSDPQSINMPNHTRSLAWAESDFKLFFEIIERLTGAASYFQSRTNQSKTLGQDEMIEKNSDTRFGMWVNRILLDFNEAITMWIEMYQDWAPKNLGERVLGDDGKQLFPNFSISTIRGGYDAKITPDIISGSKALKREIALWGLDALSQTVWFNPQINPQGNWRLTRNAAKEIGLVDIERDMPPEPKAMFQDTKLIKDKWTQLKQGEMPEIEEGDDVIELYMGFSDLVETKRDELDKEYRPNLDVFMFRLNLLMQKELQRVHNEQQANQMAMRLVRDVEEGRVKKEEAIDA